MLLSLLSIPGQRSLLKQKQFNVLGLGIVQVSHCHSKVLHLYSSVIFCLKQ